MTTILVATDFSPVAENAVEYATALAKQYQAKLVLFNAFTLPVHAANTLLPASSFDQLFLANQNRLGRKAQSIASTYGIEVEYESTYSFVKDELQNILAKYQAEMVVLGMAPKSLEQDLLGNTTTSAVKKMEFPVLAVPAGAKYHGIKKVLFACDLKHDLPVQALSRIKKLSPELRFEVEILYVDEKIAEMKSEGIGLIGSDDHMTEPDAITYSYKNVKSNAVIEEIRKEIAAIEPDVLVMVPQKHGFWTSLVHRSKTRIMASGLNIPLFIIPLQKN